MTAVASPVQLQQPSRPGWSNVNASQDGGNTMSQEDVGRLFIPNGPRKTAQRTNSLSSLSSTSSSNSTISASSLTNGTNTATDYWANRKKPTRGLWPPGKSEPTSGLSVARPQSVSSATSGPSAASGLSALHTPLLPSHQMSNGTAQQNGAVRGAGPPEGSAFLYLLPMNGTFERKTIHVPYYPDILRIGRQTNAKTAPTPANGFFDSKVLSRQHAEVYAERNGRIFIRDVKSSNGTFVNGKRLSPENKESEPHELREQDVLELGIDIVSEDQKTVVHHKVAARVEHAGVYSQAGDIGFGDIDPSGAGNFMATPQMKRVGGHAGLPGIKTGPPMGGPMSGMRDPAAMQQPWQRMWLQPISTEHIVKRLNRELNLAKQQAQDIARAKEMFDSAQINEKQSSELNEKRPTDQKSAGSPNKIDVNHFPEPPAPPPSQPLPEKPSAKAVEQMVQPFLSRADTAKPGALDLSQGDHTQTLFILTHELKAAKDQIPNLQDRVKMLEQQLRDERTARATAEERAYQLEHGPRKDSAEPNGVSALDDKSLPNSSEIDNESIPDYSIGDLSTRLARLQTNMADMKTQMESYRRRAETAENARDEARRTLAEMVEEKRARLEGTPDAKGVGSLRLAKTRSRERSTSPGGIDGRRVKVEDELEGNGTLKPVVKRPIALTALLEKAGLDARGEKVLTRQQAVSLQAVLRREVLGPEDGVEGQLARALGQLGGREKLAYHGVPHACALTTVVVGLVVMGWLNGWEKRLAP